MHRLHSTTTSWRWAQRFCLPALCLFLCLSTTSRVCAAAPGLESAPANAPLALVIPNTVDFWQKAQALPLVVAVQAYMKSPAVTGNTDYEDFQLKLAKVEQAVGYPLTGASLLS